MASHNEKMLARYSQWANKLIFEVVAALPEAEVVAPRESVFGSILRTLGHSYIVGAIFRAHIERRAHGFTNRHIPETTTFDELDMMQRDLDTWYVAWIDQVEPSELDEFIRFKFVDGSEGAMTRREMLYHVVNHYTYHRGFAVDMLHRMSVPIPKTDFTVYICDQTRQ
jgi:uncharacterized damage-inducible protein DinB